MVQLQIISQNVRGLNDPTSVKKQWLYYKTQTCNLNMLYCKEHKLCREKILGTSSLDCGKGQVAGLLKLLLVTLIKVIKVGRGGI
jgi:hypothetical protein